MVSGHACTNCKVKAHKHHITLLLNPCPASNEAAHAAHNISHKPGKNKKYRNLNPRVSCHYCRQLILFKNAIQCTGCKKVFHENHIDKIANCGLNKGLEKVLAELNLQPNLEPTSSVTNELPPFKKEPTVDVDE